SSSSSSSGSSGSSGTSSSSSTSGNGGASASSSTTTAASGGAGGEACTPLKTCENQGVHCGWIDDGCGLMINCGAYTRVPNCDQTSPYSCACPASTNYAYAFTCAGGTMGVPPPYPNPMDPNNSCIVNVVPPNGYWWWCCDAYW